MSMMLLHKDGAAPGVARLNEIVPDVEAPLARECFGSGFSPGGLWQRQKLRRAGILCQTRTLIGRDGYATFNIRKLADHCSLSAQTIYNLIGDRDQVLCAATSQHLDALLLSATRLDGYPCFFTALADAVWYHAIRNPGYAKTVISTHIKTRSAAADHMQTLMRKGLCQALEEMARHDHLRPATNIPLLAERIHSSIMFTGFDWAGNGCDDETLRRQLAVGTGLLVLGAMARSGRESMERWVDAMQRVN